jgi:hypothetical protein
LRVQRPYLHWIRDRDANPHGPPDPEAKSFFDALGAANQSATLLAKRELEFYIPEDVYIESQNGDPVKEASVRTILSGNQSEKFRTAMKKAGCCIPRGATLRSLLGRHLTRTNLDPEIQQIIEGKLIPWATVLRGG